MTYSIPTIYPIAAAVAASWAIAAEKVQGQLLALFSVFGSIEPCRMSLELIASTTNHGTVITKRLRGLYLE